MKKEDTNTYEIRLPYEKKSLRVERGQRLLEVLIDAGIFLRAECGGKGRCGKCGVKILEMSDSDHSVFDDAKPSIPMPEFRESALKLACQLKVSEDLSIEIPENSKLNPEVGQKGPIFIAKLATSLQRPRTPLERFGLAIDLGTTTIAVYLCDLQERVVIASTSVANPQAIFGEDVMSRITVISRNPQMLRRLQQFVVKAIEWAITALCESTQLDTEKIATCTLVGNSVMTHIFVKENPQSIGIFPYAPNFTEGRTFKAEALGFGFNPDADIHTLPLISGFLGSDIIAAALSTELDKSDPGTMLVDIGTNGEVMIVGKRELWATSCATGPAFEGATIRHGMHAVSGAIDRIVIDGKSGETICSVIQNDKVAITKPSGLCGTGVISAIAELHRFGLIGKDGRFNPEGSRSNFLTDDEGHLAYALIPLDKSHTRRAITLTQKDVRSIQLAKGALVAGMELICEKAGISHPKTLLVAGAFGTYIDKRDARTIGLLPNMTDENIRMIGNAAGTGAILSLFDPSLRAKAKEIAENTQVVDLAAVPEFQKKFIRSLSLSPYLS